MFSFAYTSYDEDFPTLEKKSHPKTKIQPWPFIQHREVTTDGNIKPPSQVEEILNWQMMNSRAQNQLKTIDTKLNRVTTQTSITDSWLESLSVEVRKMYTGLQKNITRLDIELRQFIDERRSLRLELYQKEQ